MDYVQTRDAVTALLSGKSLKGSGDRLFCMDESGKIWTWKKDDSE